MKTGQGTKRNNATGKYVKPFNAIEVKRIKKELALKPNKRNYALFVLAINQGIRSTDLLKLKFGDLAELAVGDKFGFDEGKTGKRNFIMMNNATHDALHIYLDSLADYQLDNFLFSSRKGNKAITLQQFGRIIKVWCGYAKIKTPSDYGVRSLRKTFGRLAFDNSDDPKVVTFLKERFNHASEATTLKYLDITRKDIYNLFDDK